MAPEALLAWLFWACWALVVYAHAGYPLLMLAVARLAGPARAPAARAAEPPAVACIVAAYNEERHVRARIDNFLAQGYPADRLRVYMGSDGSRDRTPELLRAAASEQVRVFAFERNRGKASVLNDLVAASTEPILVLSDANTMYEPGAIERLVRHFDDPTVGAVCGELKLLDANGNNQDSAYWRIEQMLKRSEARIGGLLGANGAIYALRRELYVPIAPDTVVDDFCIAMTVVASGKRLVYDAEAVALEDTPDTMADEYRRRVRIGIGNYQAFFRHPEYLWRTGAATAFTYLSHKVLRWFTPHLLALALLASSWLALSSPLWAAIALAQWLGYGAVALYQVLPRPPQLPKLLALGVFFLTLNWAFAVGFWRYVTGRYSGSWRTARA